MNMGALGVKVAIGWNDVQTYANAIYGTGDSAAKDVWIINAKAAAAQGKKIDVPKNIVSPTGSATGVGKPLTAAQALAASQQQAVAKSSSTMKYVLAGGAALVGIALVVYLISRR